MQRGKRNCHCWTIVLCTFLRCWTALTVHAAEDVLVVLTVSETYEYLGWKDMLTITATQAGPATIITSDNSTLLDLPNGVLHFHSPSNTQPQLLGPLELLKGIKSGTLNSGGTTISTFEWLLWGTPTTFVLRENLQAVLQPFDSKLPYVITDETYRSGASYPACLPCHWGRSRSQAVQGGAAQVLPAGG